MNSRHKIYLGLTTTGNSNWREKIEEIKALDLKEIAVFPTTVEKKERRELYRSLKKTPIKYVPFVHLRHDFTMRDVEFFQKNFGTRLFNTHATVETVTNFISFPNHKTQIYLENAWLNINGKIFVESLKDFAGICLDVSHWEDYGVRQKEAAYKNFAKILKDHPIGFAHLTSVRQKPYFRDYGKSDRHKWHYSAHLMEMVSDFDYLKKYLDYLPEIMGIELENPLKEQLEAKKYIARLANGLEGLQKPILIGINRI